MPLPPPYSNLPPLLGYLSTSSLSWRALLDLFQIFVQQTPPILTTDTLPLLSLIQPPSSNCSLLFLPASISHNIFSPSLPSFKILVFNILFRSGFLWTFSGRAMLWLFLYRTLLQLCECYMTKGAISIKNFFSLAYRPNFSKAWNSVLYCQPK